MAVNFATKTRHFAQTCWDFAGGDTCDDQLGPYNYWTSPEGILELQDEEDIIVIITGFMNNVINRLY